MPQLLIAVRSSWPEIVQSSRRKSVYVGLLGADDAYKRGYRTRIAFLVWSLHQIVGNMFAVFGSRGGSVLRLVSTPVSAAICWGQQKRTEEDMSTLSNRDPMASRHSATPQPGAVIAAEKRLTPWEQCFSGAAAGCVATVPMTAAMGLGFRMLPSPERYALPPRQITVRVAERVGVADHMDRDEKTAATTAAHFGYGAAMGGIYACLVPGAESQNVASGVAFGLAVWTGSYLGLLPALGLLSSAVQHPVRRSLLMIGAHVVWGAALGAGTRQLQQILREQGR